MSFQCIYCQHNAPRQFKLRYGKLIILKPMEVFGMDFAGPIFPAGYNGRQHALVGFKYFTGFILTQCLDKVDGHSVAVICSDILSPVVGWPDVLSTDNCSHFANKGVEDLFEHYGTRTYHGPTKYPPKLRVGWREQ